jgi:hypothetical protein
MSKNRKSYSQLTLDSVQATPQKTTDKTISQYPEKQIIITEICTATKIDELLLRVSFSLCPSKAAFSKVQMDL